MCQIYKYAFITYIEKRLQLLNINESIYVSSTVTRSNLLGFYDYSDEQFQRNTWSIFVNFYQFSLQAHSQQRKSYSSRIRVSDLFC